MPKRKAGGQGGGARPSRPQPLPPVHDDGDSEFCEVIEPSSSSVSHLNRSSTASRAVPPPLSALSPRLAPAPPRPDSRCIPALAHGHNDARNAEVLSVLAGLSQGMSYIQPAGPGSVFPFGSAPPTPVAMGLPQHLGNVFRAHPFGRAAPETLANSNPRGSRHAEGSAPHGCTGLPLGADPSTKEASARPRVRVREGAGAEEVKEEPAEIRPTEEELSPVAIIRAHGLSTADAVTLLRRNGQDLQVALQKAFEIVANRRHCELEDRVRLESEKDKEKVAAQKRQDDLTLTVLGDIAPRFRESLLLDEDNGCGIFRQAIDDLRKGEEAWTPASSTFRERAVNLLFLEQNTLRWYRQNTSEVQEYFREVINRIGDFADGRRGGAEGAVDSAEAKPPAVPQERAGSARLGQRAVEKLTLCVQREVEALEKILYALPTTSGGLPDAFLRCKKSSATLEADGVEEICHRSGDSSRPGSEIVEIDD